MAKLRREETGDFRRSLLTVSIPGLQALQERRRLFSAMSGFYASNGIPGRLDPWLGRASNLAALVATEPQTVNCGLLP